MIDPHDPRTSDELIAAVQVGERVQQLTEQPGWDDLLTEIRVVRDTRLYTLINGNPFDAIEKYADKTGEVRGLEQIAETAEAVIKAGQQASEQLQYMEAQA